MNKTKNTITAGILISVALLSSGCMQQQPKVKIETIRTTKEVVIPYNDRVKKAVAILISKINVLEKQVNQNSKLIKNTNVPQETKNAIDEIRKKVDIEDKLIKKNIKDIQAIKEKPVHSEIIKSPSSVVIKENHQPDDNDAIIKEFIEEGTLK